MRSFMATENSKVKFFSLLSVFLKRISWFLYNPLKYCVLHLATFSFTYYKPPSHGARCQKITLFPSQFLLSSHLLNIYRLFNSDHASQGKEADSFRLNFLFARFPSLNYHAVFVHKRKKIPITWHIPRFLLADISFSRLVVDGKLISVNRLLRK